MLRTTKLILTVAIFCAAAIAPASAPAHAPGPNPDQQLSALRAADTYTPPVLPNADQQVDGLSARANSAHRAPAVAQPPHPASVNGNDFDWGDAGIGAAVAAALALLAVMGFLAIAGRRARRLAGQPR